MVSGHDSGGTHAADKADSYYSHRDFLLHVFSFSVGLKIRFHLNNRVLLFILVFKASSSNSLPSSGNWACAGNERQRGEQAVQQGAGEGCGRLRLDAQQAGREVERVDVREAFLPMSGRQNKAPLFIHRGAAINNPWRPRYRRF
jgi:hypothetical protein